MRLALPQGEFVLPDPPPAKILFWTGGSGITPVMSMLRTLDCRGTMPDVVHIHSAPTMDSGHLPRGAARPGGAAQLGSG